MERIRIVLCRPSHPGNIGAAARAMKAMGLDDLRLVAPERFPAPEAEWMATSAVDVLQRARIHSSLHDAIKDCVAAFALSARPREWSPQVLDVRSAVVRARELANDVAFVFGNETAGLTNEEMFACQVLAYEIFVAAGAAVPPGKTEKLATVEDIEGLYAHLEEAALDSEFFVPGSGSRLRERWRRLFSRVPALEREEVNILRGLLRALLAKRRGQ